MFTIRDCNEIELNKLDKLDIDKNIIKILKYFDNEIFFYNKRDEYINDNACWVNFTGLTSYRPFIIIDYLFNNNIINSNSNILDIGCGLSEMGIELNRKYNYVKYTGLDINNNLINLNNLNIKNQNFKFINFDFKNINDYNKLNNTYNIIFACGATIDIIEIFPYICDNIKPNYIVCESHINRKNDLINIINVCKNYSVINNDGYNFSYKSVNGPDDINWIGYKRILYILKKNI